MIKSLRKTLIIVLTVEDSLVFFTEQIAILRGQYNVHVLCGRGSRNLRDRYKLAWGDGVNIEYIPATRKFHLFKDAYACVYLILRFTRIQPSIIHSYTPKAGLLATLAGKLAGVEHRVHTFTGLLHPTSYGIKKKVLVMCDQFILRWCTRAVAESKGVRRQLKAIADRRVDIIGGGSLGGVNTRRFAPSVKTAENNTKGIRLLYIGRLASDKGIELLVEAVKRLKINNGALDLKLMLAGDMDARDPIDKRLVQFIKETEWIQMLGYQEDVRPLFNVVDILVLPSLREGFPNVVLESLAMEVPVISTMVPGAEDVVVNKVTGWTCQSGSIQSLYDAVNAAVSTSTIKRREYGKMGRQLVQKMYDSSIVAKNLSSYYLDMMAHNHNQSF